MAEIKTLANCSLREFLAQTNKIRKDAAEFLELTKISKIRQHVPAFTGEETEEEKEVVPNLMIGFGIDEVQAEYVAEIKLRHLNREYIMNRLADIEQLEKEIAEIKALLDDEIKMKSFMIKQLNDIKKKYGKNAILKGMNLQEGATTIDRNNQIGGHRA